MGMSTWAGDSAAGGAVTIIRAERVPALLPWVIPRRASFGPGSEQSSAGASGQEESLTDVYQAQTPGQTQTSLHFTVVHLKLVKNKQKSLVTQSCM